MEIASFLNNVEWNESKPAIKVMVENTASKEIRIAMKEGQLMKEHKAPFPISVQVLEGSIIFGVEGKGHEMVAGDIICLDANVPHDLTAQKPSIIRLSLSKKDTVERVKKV